MARNFYILILLLLTTGLRQTYAQQEPQLSLYMYNPTYYNPAAVGAEGLTRIQLTHRTQYLGYQAIGSGDEAVQSSQVLSGNMALNRLKSGVGLYVMNDRMAANTNQSIQLAYAYRMALKSGTLALGVQAGFFNRGYDYSLFRPGNPNDPLIPTGRISQAKPDIAAGVYYNTTDFWVGLSANHLNKAAYTLGVGQPVAPLNPNVYLTGGYRLMVGNDIELQPSVLVQYSTMGKIRDSQVTLSAIGTYANRFWAGVGYRFQESAMFTAGLHLLPNNALRIGYALDLVLQNTKARSLTSHEVQLSYALPSPDARKKPIIRTPRFRY